MHHCLSYEKGNHNGSPTRIDPEQTNHQACTESLISCSLGQVRSECLTCTFRASCSSARLSRAQVPGQDLQFEIKYIINTIRLYTQHVIKRLQVRDIKRERKAIAFNTYLYCSLLQPGTFHRHVLWESNLACYCGSLPNIATRPAVYGTHLVNCPHSFGSI